MLAHPTSMEPTASREFSNAFVAASPEKRVTLTTDYILDSGSKRKIVTASDFAMTVEGTGTLNLEIPDTNGQIINISLNADYVPEACTTLISANDLIQLGYEIRLGKKYRLLITPDQKQHAQLPTKGGMPILPVLAPKSHAKFTLSKRNVNYLRAHLMYGHAGRQRLAATLGIPESKIEYTCTQCAIANLKWAKSRPGPHAPRATAPKQAITTDVLGPFPVPSYGKSHKYAAVYRDLFSSMIYVYFMKTTAEIKDTLQDLRTHWHGIDQKPASIYIDNATYYVGGEFAKLCKQWGWSLYTCAPHRHWSHPAEGCLRPLQEATRAHLATSGLTADFWTSALFYATYMRNATVSRGHRKSPFGTSSVLNLETGSLTKTDTLEVFEQALLYQASSFWSIDDYTQNLPQHHKDLVQQHGKRLKSNALRVPAPPRQPSQPLRPDIDSAAEHRNDASLAGATPETLQDHTTPTPAADADSTGAPTAPSPRDSYDTTRVGIDHDNPMHGQPHDNSPDSFDSEDDEPAPVRKQPKATRSGRVPKLTEFIDHGEEAFGPAGRYSFCAFFTNLKGYIWSETPCPWVFVKKRTGQLKSRLVAVGTSEPVSSSADVYAPTADKATLRITTILALTLGFSFAQCDVSQAYLYSKVDPSEKLYVRLPHGIPGHEKGTIMALRKSIYGIRTAGSRWHQYLAKILKSLGYAECMSDQSLYIRHKNGTLESMIVTYVDDVRIAAKVNALEGILNAIRKSLKITTEQTESMDYLGSQYTHDKATNTVTISQSKYAQQMLNERELQNLNPARTPMETGQTLPDHDTEEADPNYRSSIGALLYLLNSRPDLAFTLHELSRHCHRNSTVHNKALQRAFRYVQGTKDKGLTLRGLSKGEPLRIDVFTDASYNTEGDPHRKGTTGYIIAIGKTPVVWRSIRQSSVAGSSAHAELIAIDEGYKRALGVRHLLEDIGFNARVIRVHTDSQTVINQLAKGSLTAASRHIANRFIRLTFELDLGNLELVHVPGKDQPADTLTKSLPFDTFAAHRDAILNGCLPIPNDPNMLVIQRVEGNGGVIDDARHDELPITLTPGGKLL
ncbi:Transposon Ty1-DR3 Gag-Pol polyprotein [Hondaea fermentalgiana]|uniref:Transposon Ty1-DR3 Gag-Pol polyprotein n=1 Tax=Hondaea fermentalgiana TaxID=2315210 RepID=A0A2R5FKW7_9STRA|nr:Transposon Ty1-DR3 Gag-Pol polyprotein [Hondaea fermentalgiana]|eukprot:GBG16294.1 Transposon Ty1-DR3 Gag-Pol polyprotein [Hondaea fermentalgiana]